MLIDVKYNLLNTIITNSKSNKRELIKQHMKKNIEDKINLEKTIIIIFDRSYISTELMLFLEKQRKKLFIQIPD
ncbi:MAG: hypothetical protein E7Z86_04985 [Methanosphaera stadtmanae]|jgi:uncharacterized UPF0160 family protein|nr:hypothetical protein [Methanosphaera stadtmanae]